MRVTLVAIALAVSSSAVADPALSLDHTFVTNGFVTATASDGATVYLGGKFDYVGQRSGTAVLVSATTGAWNKSVVAGSVGRINAIVDDGRGGYFVGGDIRAAGSTRLRGLAHIKADGTWDSTFAPIFNNPVYALAHDATTLYVGGAFRNVNGVVRIGFAAFDLATGELTTLVRNTGSIYAMAIDGSMLFVGGSFGGIDGQPRNNLARLDLPSATVSAWNPGANSDVNTLLATGSTVYVGGKFTALGTRARNSVGAIDANTGAVRGFDPNVTGAVHAFARQNGKLYLGGFVSSIGGQPRSLVGAVDASTGAVLPFDPHVHSNSGVVDALLATPTALYIGGSSIDTIGGQPRNDAGAVDPASAAVLPWDAHPSDGVASFAVHPAGILVGGSFNSVNGQSRANLAAIDLSTGRATTWKPRTDLDPTIGENVRTLLLSGSTIYVGGLFRTIDGQPRANLAAISTSGTVLPFRADATGAVLTGQVETLALRNSTLYVGGNFTSVAGTTRNHLAAVDATTGALQGWNPNANAIVRALVAVGSTVYAGGEFTMVNGVANRRLSSIDATTGAPGPDSATSDTVWSLSSDGTNVYAGGFFDSVNGAARNGLAAIVPGTLNVTSWVPALAPGTVVFATASTSTSVYASASSPNDTLTIVDKSTGALEHANTTIPTCSWIIVQPTKLIVGGAFTSINTLPQQGIAVYSGTP